MLTTGHFFILWILDGRTKMNYVLYSSDLPKVLNPRRTLQTLPKCVCEQVKLTVSLDY